MTESNVIHKPVRYHDTRPIQYYFFATAAFDTKWVTGPGSQPLGYVGPLLPWK